MTVRRAPCSTGLTLVVFDGCPAPLSIRVSAASIWCLDRLSVAMKASTRPRNPFDMPDPRPYRPNLPALLASLRSRANPCLNRILSSTRCEFDKAICAVGSALAGWAERRCDPG